MDAPQRHDPLKAFVLIAAATFFFVLGAAWHGCVRPAQAGVYGHRIDKHGSHIYWLTQIDPQMGAEFEIPGHGLCLAHVVVDPETGEGELWLESQGDQEGPRSLVVRGVVVNQLRVSFER